MTAEKGVTTYFQRDTELLHDLQTYQADVVNPKIDVRLGVFLFFYGIMEMLHVLIWLCSAFYKPKAHGQ